MYRSALPRSVAWHATSKDWSHVICCPLWLIPVAYKARFCLRDSLFIHSNDLRCASNNTGCTLPRIPTASRVCHGFADWISQVICPDLSCLNWSISRSSLGVRCCLSDGRFSSLPRCWMIQGLLFLGFSPHTETPYLGNFSLFVSLRSANVHTCYWFCIIRPVFATLARCAHLIRLPLSYISAPPPALAHAWCMLVPAFCSSLPVSVCWSLLRQ